MDVRTAAWVFLLLLTTKGMANAAAATPAPLPRAAVVPANAAELFSRRARRRAAVLLRLRWEELRMAELERVRAAIRRQLPVDALLQKR